MTFAQIQSFLKLVEFENFSVAADALFIAQSTLSKHIKALETELGTRLLNRNSRGFSLTQDGLRFLSFATAVDGEYQQLLQQLRVGRRQKVLIISMSSAMWLISQKTQQFQSQHPQIEIVIFESDQDNILNAAKEFDADLMFVWDYAADTSKYPCVPMTTHQLVLAVSKSHPLAGRDIVSLAELKRENFIMMHQAIARKFIIKSCQSAGFTPNVQYYVTSTDTMYRYVSENLGVALLYASESYPFDEHFGFSDSVRQIPLAENISSQMVFARCKKTASPAVEAYLRFMQEQLRPEGAAR